MSKKKEEPKIQCVCGRIIESAADYKLLYLKKELNEIDILCPNDTCYLRELGFIKFRVDENGNVKVEKIAFYPPFVTWNVSRLGKEIALKLLKQHLKDLVTKYVDWDKIKADVLKRMKESQAKGEEKKEEEKESKPEG